jgi:hypothetical protein
MAKGGKDILAGTMPISGSPSGVVSKAPYQLNATWSDARGESGAPHTTLKGTMASGER